MSKCIEETTHNYVISTWPPLWLFCGCTSHNSLGVHQWPVDGSTLVHPMECYLIVKRIEALIDAATQTSLGNTTLVKEARTKRPPAQALWHAISRAARNQAAGPGGAEPGRGRVLAGSGRSLEGAPSPAGGGMNGLESHRGDSCAKHTVNRGEREPHLSEPSKERLPVTSSLLNSETSACVRQGPGACVSPLPPGCEHQLLGEKGPKGTLRRFRGQEHPGSARTRPTPQRSLQTTGAGQLQTSPTRQPREPCPTSG